VVGVTIGGIGCGESCNSVMEEYKRRLDVKVETPSYDSCSAASLRPYDPGEIPV
jgi:hypothetical protein